MKMIWVSYGTLPSFLLNRTIRSCYYALFAMVEPIATAEWTCSPYEGRINSRIGSPTGVGSVPFTGMERLIAFDNMSHLFQKVTVGALPPQPPERDH